MGLASRRRCHVVRNRREKDLILDVAPNVREHAAARIKLIVYVLDAYGPGPAIGNMKPVEPIEIRHGRRAAVTGGDRYTGDALLLDVLHLAVNDRPNNDLLDQEPRLAVLTT